MSEMTPRQRVQTALMHQEPDRVPLDIEGGSSSSIVVEGYERLKEYLEMPGETKILHKAFRIARLDESVLQRLGSDVRPLTSKPPARWVPPPDEPGMFTLSIDHLGQAILTSGVAGEPPSNRKSSDLTFCSRRFYRGIARG
jgi:hypothetical protein